MTATDKVPSGSKGVAAFFREHPALIGTLLYIQVNAVGVVYSWALFREFGINVFDYAEANDFLLAAFREPLAFVQGALSLIAIPAVLALTSRFRKRRDASAPLWLSVHTWFMIIAIIPYTVFPAYLTARRNAAEVRNTNKFNVDLYLNPRTQELQPELLAESTSLVGTTESLPFLYDRTNNVVVAVPRSNINRLIIPSMQRREPSPCDDGEGDDPGRSMQPPNQTPAPDGCAAGEA